MDWTWSQYKLPNILLSLLTQRPQTCKVDTHPTICVEDPGWPHPLWMQRALLTETKAMRPERTQPFTHSCHPIADLGMPNTHYHTKQRSTAPSFVERSQKKEKETSSPFLRQAGNVFFYWPGRIRSKGESVSPIRSHLPRKTSQWPWWQKVTYSILLCVPSAAWTRHRVNSGVTVEVVLVPAWA